METAVDMSPLERAVRAIRGGVYESDDVADHMHQEAALRTARAVLQAIREPSESAILDGVQQADVSGEEVRDIWQVMLAAVLDEWAD